MAIPPRLSLQPLFYRAAGAATLFFTANNSRNSEPPLARRKRSQSRKRAGAADDQQKTCFYAGSDQAHVALLLKSGPRPRSSLFGSAVPIRRSGGPIPPKIRGPSDYSRNIPGGDGM